jgi:DNA-binding MarR family transcriptional regulator
VATTRWLHQDEMTAWRTLLHAHASLVATLDRELRESHDMTLADYEVLVFLSEAPGGQLPMAALAERARISPSALTRRVDRLVKLGWVTRQACDTDARVSYAVLVDEGRRQLEAAAPTHVDGVRRHFIDRLTPGQIQQLTDALQSAVGKPAC